jgi:hypothetical protein
MQHVFDFEDLDERLELFPLAARRAVDALGAKLSLDAWKGLPLGARQELVRFGAADRVDLEAVRGVLGAAIPAAAPCPSFTELGAAPPDAAELGAGADAEALTARWERLPGLARYTLLKVTRGKTRANLGRAVAELAARYARD